MERAGSRPQDNGNLWVVMPRLVEELLPTPTVMDMGGGRTPEEWEAWKQAMKAKHANGNGHGRSLEQELLGASTPLQLTDGNDSPDQRQPQPSPARTDDHDSALTLWNG